VAGESPAGGMFSDVQVVPSVVVTGQSPPSEMSSDVSVVTTLSVAGESPAGEMASAVFVGEESSLDLTGLEAWWKLDESSGNAIDAHTTGRDLTEFGTVGTISTAIGPARNWGSANHSNHFRQNSPIFQSNGNSFHISGWVTVDTAASRWIAGVYPTSTIGPSNRWALIYAQSVNRFRWILKDEIGSANTLIDSGITLQNNNLYFVEAFYNSSNQQGGIAVNRGLFVTGNTSGGISTGGTPGDLYIGRVEPTNLPAMLGTVKDFTFWSTLPTEERRDYLWNDGNGNTYPG
jgi:hypothetical protein